MNPNDMSPATSGFKVCPHSKVKLEYPNKLKAPIRLALNVNNISIYIPVTKEYLTETKAKTITGTRTRE